MPELSGALLDNLGLGLVIILVGAANYWKARRAEQAGSEAARAGGDVRRTLTTKNSGSHVRDQLDRIETTGEATRTEVADLKRRVENLERRPRLPFLFALTTLWRIR